MADSTASSVNTDPASAQPAAKMPFSKPSGDSSKTSPPNEPKTTGPSQSFLPAPYTLRRAIPLSAVPKSGEQKADYDNENQTSQTDQQGQQGQTAEDNKTQMLPCHDSKCRSYSDEVDQVTMNPHTHRARGHCACENGTGLVFDMLGSQCVVYHRATESEHYALVEATEGEVDEGRETGESLLEENRDSKEEGSESP